MNLRVRFPNGDVVADVDAEPSCPFAQDPQSGSFVLGSFVPGPAFPRVREKLDAFLTVFATGSIAEASDLHDELDRLGLVASDPSGSTYRVSNISFQQGGLLFNANPMTIALRPPEV